MHHHNSAELTYLPPTVPADRVAAVIPLKILNAALRLGLRCISAAHRLLRLQCLRPPKLSISIPSSIPTQIQLLHPIDPHPPVSQAQAHADWPQRPSTLYKRCTKIDTRAWCNRGSPRLAQGFMQERAPPSPIACYTEWGHRTRCSSCSLDQTKDDGLPARAAAKETAANPAAVTSQPAAGCDTQALDTVQIICIHRQSPSRTSHAPPLQTLSHCDHPNFATRKRRDKPQEKKHTSINTGRPCLSCPDVPSMAACLGYLFVKHPPPTLRPHTHTTTSQGLHPAPHSAPICPLC